MSMTLGVVERTPYGDFVREMPEIKRGIGHGYPIEYADMGGLHLVLRVFIDGEWRATGNVAQPVTRCLTSVADRRRLLRAMRGG